LLADGIGWILPPSLSRPSFIAGDLSDCGMESFFPDSPETSELLLTSDTNDP